MLFQTERLDEMTKVQITPKMILPIQEEDNKTATTKVQTYTRWNYLISLLMLLVCLGVGCGVWVLVV